MPKKSVEKTPNKTLELDKKLSAIKGEVDAIIDEEEKQIPEIEPEPVKQPKKQPKIIEEIVEEEDPEPIIIRKIIKKKPKQIIEEVIEEDEEDLLQKKKKDGRGRPRKIQEPEQQDYEIQDKKSSGRAIPDTKYISQKQKIQMPQSRHRQEDQQKTYQNRDRFDTILDETNIDLLRQEMRKEMKRRLMSSLFD
jgi:hypothetical protein